MTSIKQTLLTTQNVSRLKLGLLAVSAAFASGAAYGATISQTGFEKDTGSANYGEEFEVSSDFFTEDQTLDSITFYKGLDGGGSSTLYLDIYSLSPADSASPNFSSGSNTGSLSYLGSSDNFIDYTTLTGSGSSSNGLGDPMVFTFTGITLPRDVDLFAVFSSDGIDGNWVGTSTNNESRQNSLSFTNIVNGDSDPLFGGVGDASIAEDNVYSIELTPVPEPGSLALLGLGGLLIARRRRD